MTDMLSVFAEPGIGLTGFTDVVTADWSLPSSGAVTLVPLGAVNPI